ncbi:MAG: putative transcriptional regulator of viral defense system [Candidatus Azotimanducaceae bacterium]|jgi:predicted transcriptional regulator of viral defense system
MQTLTEQLIEEGLAERVLTDGQVSRLVEGSRQRRYHLVNRAMKAGELIRLRRGLYMLADKYRSQPCHPYMLAQVLVPGGYVSLESALSFHGWIPEAVYTTASIVPNRKMKDFSYEQMGLFTFDTLPVREGFFLELVQRVELAGQGVLMASPLRALMDLVCLKKTQWRGVEWLEQGMRIDRECLRAITSAQVRTLKAAYKPKRVTEFLAGLERVLGLELGND